MWVRLWENGFKLVGRLVSGRPRWKGGEMFKMKNRAKGIPFMLAIAISAIFIYPTRALGTFSPAAAFVLASQTVVISDSIVIDIKDDGAAESPTTAPSATPTPVGSSAVAVRQLYLSPSGRSAGPGEELTAELVLRVANADGTALDRFGITFDFSGLAEANVLSKYDGKSVAYSGDTLWFEKTAASGGRVISESGEVSFSFSFIPFAMDSEAERTAVSLKFLDGLGQPVELSDDGEYAIRERMSIARKGSETPGEMEQDTPLPDNTQATPEPSVTLPPQDTPVPRQLLLHANIAPEYVALGDTLVLTAELVGYENESTVIRWQQRRDGVWDNVPDATGDTLTIVITDENRHDAWRYEVTILPKETEAAE